MDDLQSSSHQNESRGGIIALEVWLYGRHARLAPEQGQAGYARLHIEMPGGSTMRDLVQNLGLALGEKGITFVNGQLTDLPGLAADLDRELKDGDRIGFFDRKSMWPFQYRFGANVSGDLQQAMLRQAGGIMRHSGPR